jgi:hypothetical protein
MEATMCADSKGANDGFKFLETEYKEACNTYRMGAQIGVTFLNTYLFGNGILGALFGAAANIFGTKGEHGKLLLILIPSVAILVSLLLFFFLPHYEKYVDRVGARCGEIEAKFGGKLFLEIEEVGRSSRLNAFRGLKVLAIIFAGLWLFLLLFAYRTEPSIESTLPG